MNTAIGPHAQPRNRSWILEALYVTALTGLTLGFIAWF